MYSNYKYVLDAGIIINILMGENDMQRRGHLYMRVRPAPNTFDLKTNLVLSFSAVYIYRSSHRPQYHPQVHFSVWFSEPTITSLKSLTNSIFVHHLLSIKLIIINRMGRAPCCDKNGLKKGPWTPEEDHKLISYIQLHGPGNWRNLPKNAGKLSINLY